MIRLLTCLLPACLAAALPAAASASPREVAVGVYLLDVTSIDETANAYTAEADVFVSWRDTTLAFDAAAHGAPVKVHSGPEATARRHEIWSAQIYPTNPVGSLAVNGEKLVEHADGRVELTGRITTTLRARLDYRRFPFDSQVLPVEVESFNWNRDDVVLVLDPEHTGHEPLRALAEWRITGLETDAYEVERVRDVVPFSNLAFRYTVQRDPGYYLLKIFLTVVIIVALTWVVFWMSGEGLGRRAGVSSGGILTVIAYQFVTTSSLPKVSYLTVADRVMLLSIVMIALTMVESLVVDRWTVTAPEKKLRVDRACRVVFPVVYLGALLALAVRNGLLA